MPELTSADTECGCDPASGCCAPQFDAVSRRAFIKLAGVGAAGVLASPAWGDWVKQQGSTAELSAWKADLFKPATARKYTSAAHGDVKFPLGGIGTGNFELGSDGQFTTWQLFNTLRDGYVPFCFAARVGTVAKMLQTSGGPNWPRVAGIEMTGEYPFATLNYQDPEIPVSIELTAFSPFAPLDSQFSAIPAAIFTFKLHNPTATDQTVSLAGFMQNAIGYDAIGVPISFNSVGFNEVKQHTDVSHPNFGGNYNRAYKVKGASVLSMHSVPGKPAKLDRKTALFTNVDVRALTTRPDNKPDNLKVASFDAVGADKSTPATEKIVWLEEAAANIPADALQSARDAVHAGATLIFSGVAQPLLAAYAAATQGKPLTETAIRPDVVFDDFENGYGKWKVTGKAFGTEPAHGTLAGQQTVTGFIGHGLVNSFLDGDDTTGRMVSEPFTIDRNFIRFLVGGGRQPNTAIRLIVDGKTVRTASGKEEEKLLPETWNVAELIGKSAHLEIVDDSTGGWGHINVDHIVFSDDPGHHLLFALLEELLPARLTLPKAAGASYQLDAHKEGAKAGTIQRTGHTTLGHKVGAGQVIVVQGPIIDHNQAELIGARHAAYETVCNLTGAKYEAPNAVPSTAPGHGALALMTNGPDSTIHSAFTDWEEAWKEFRTAGRFQPVPANGHSSAPTKAGSTVNGAIATTVQLAPGATREVVFCLAWRYPNKYNGGGTSMGCHYATVWPEVDAVVKTVAQDYPKLRARTERFRKAMYDSTLPYWLLDCVTSQISTIRHSGVVFRIANGDVFGWEGSNGCCQPTCTHVWGYEQTLAHVFPDLEQLMREIDYKHQQRPDGGIDNRTDVPSPPRPTGEQPFSDGHASCVLKAYREALNAPDDTFLKAYWPGVKRAVEYLIGRDAATSNGTPDGTLSDDQWNTYDNAIHGVNTFIGSYYLAALRAGEEMAKKVGDAAAADHFHSVFEKGQKKLVELCWNGEYFEQNLPDYMKRAGEYGPGCLSDQLIGQWWAHQLGLGYVLPKEMVVKALKSVFKYNWLPDFSNFQHNWRKFAGGNDKGLLICSWPRGGRPANTIPYVDEVWTGVEYQVAAHMLYEGLMEEGLAVVKAARDRYDGVPRDPMPRNPWNEIECGGHYARAMSSWSVLTALSGFRYDGTTATLLLTPRIQKDAFKSLFTGPEGWGSVNQVRKPQSQRNELHVVEGQLKLGTLHLEAAHSVKKATVTIGTRRLAATVSHEGSNAVVTLPAGTVVKQGEKLAVTLA